MKTFKIGDLVIPTGAKAYAGCIYDTEIAETKGKLGRVIDVDDEYCEVEFIDFDFVFVFHVTELQEA